MKKEPIKNLIPNSISFGDLDYAAMRCEGITIFMRVDEKKARKILRHLLKNGRKIQSAILGLNGDWDLNSCEIYDGKYFHPYEAYEGSRWATPTLIVNFHDGPSEAYECHRDEVVDPI
jgi:hypothetical protein